MNRSSQAFCSLILVILSSGMTDSVRGQAELSHRAAIRIQEPVPFRISSAESTAQDSLSISGPVLGFLFDASRNGFRAILGIPGSSLLGSAVPLEAPVTRSWISPRNNYALAETRAGDLLLINFPESMSRAVLLDVCGGGERTIAIDSSGRTALVWNKVRRSFQKIVDLPAAPRVGTESAISLPPGEVTALAISGNAFPALAGIRSRDSATVYFVEESRNPVLVYQGGDISALSFLPDGTGALIADVLQGRIWMLAHAGEAASIAPLEAIQQKVADPLALEVSSDGRFILAAGRDGVAWMDRRDGRVTALSGSVSLTGLYRLSGTDIFRLNEISDEPLLITLPGPQGPQLLFVPVDSGTAPRPRRDLNRRLP